MVTNHFQESQSRSSVCYTPSSLLIPARYLKYYISRCLAMGGRRQYFNFIVESFLPCISLFQEKLLQKKSNRWKKNYQTSGQDLLKKNFSPYPEDWESLRDVADAFGVSICFLFIFFMELEIAGQIPEKKDSQEVERSSSFKHKINLKKKAGFCFFGRFLDFERAKLTRYVKMKI